jgi:hypothetical protein
MESRRSRFWSDYEAGDSGWALFPAAQAGEPQILTILVTATSVRAGDRLTNEVQIFRFINKPVNVGLLKLCTPHARYLARLTRSLASIPSTAGGSTNRRWLTSRQGEDCAKSGSPEAAEH